MNDFPQLEEVCTSCGGEQKIVVTEITQNGKQNRIRSCPSCINGYVLTENGKRLAGFLERWFIM